MSDIVMSSKRVLRKFIPDRVMARYRLHQHSKHTRVNVDIVVPDHSSAKRWMSTTPDTYRAVVIETTRDGENSGRSFGADAARAEQLLALGTSDVAVVGNAGKPKLISARRDEPVIDPTGMALTEEALGEVGGFPTGDWPLRTLLARVRDAGRTIILEPHSSPGEISATRRDAIELPVVMIVSAVPLHDIGGGSRASQLALEFLDSGAHVVFVSVFGAQESVDLGLRFISPNLEQYRLDRFDSSSLIERATSPGLCIAELPARGAGDTFAAFKAAGWTTVYDVIDDWSDPALGGDWYTAETERWYLQTADHVIASAPDLVERCADLGVPAVLVPNGVNVRVFSAAGDVEGQLAEHSGPVFGYHGSLYGNWFDWASLERVARSYPEALIVIIGDDKVHRPAMPENVRFVGLMPQTDLPPWVRGFDVGLLPFVLSGTTHAVSPLKVYEYLACGVPVAAPPLRALDGIASIYVADALVDAVTAALAAEPVDVLAARRDHGWRQRIDTITSLAEFEVPPTGDEPVVILTRAVTHHERPDRVVDLTAGRISSS